MIIYIKVVTWLLFIFILFDISISTLAIQRQMERRENIQAVGIIDEALDVYYPDEKLNEIYSSAKETKNIK